MVRQYPIDLAAVSIAAAVAYVIVTNQPEGTAVRLLATVGLVCLLPGYALVSVLFPAAEREGRAEATASGVSRPRGIGDIERVGLALPLSLAVVVLVALVLAVTEWGFQTESTTAALAIVTVGLAQLGVVRRLRLSRSKRVTFAPVSTLRRVRRSQSIGLSAVVLVVAIGLAVGALTFALFVPASADGFTELGLYSETDDGELVAGEFPSTVSPNESIDATIAIDNEEGDDRAYTVVIQQQTIDDDEVVDRETMGVIDADVADGEQWTSEEAIGPTAEPGETVRLSVLLYDDEPPAEPTTENASQETYVWVTVSE